jgi:hypothetical protein
MCVRSVCQAVAHLLLLNVELRMNTVKQARKKVLYLNLPTTFCIYCKILKNLLHNTYVNFLLNISFPIFYSILRSCQYNYYYYYAYYYSYNNLVKL